MAYFRTVILIILVPLILYADGTQLPFIEYGIGGKGGALGNAFVSIADDGTAPFHNPAGMNKLNYPIFTLSYINTSLVNMNMLYLSYLTPFKYNLKMGISFLWEGVSSLQGYDETQSKTSPYSLSRILFSTSLAYPLKKKYFLGATVKILYTSIFTYSASTFDMDTGFIFSPFKNFYSGIVIQNFLPLKYKLFQEKEGIPLSAKIGVSYTFLLKNTKFLLSCDVYKQIEPSFSQTTLKPEAGLAIYFFRSIMLAAGYSSPEITFGFLAEVGKFTFYTGNSKTPQGNHLQFTLSYKFETEKSGSTEKEIEYFYQGVVAYRNKDYRTAIKYFKKVLEIRYDPVAEYYLNNARAYLSSEEWMTEEEKELIKMKMNLARKYIDEKKYGKAIKTLREVLDINPDHEEAEDLIAKIKDKVKDEVERLYKEALKAFNKKDYYTARQKCEEALALDPEYDPVIELKMDIDKILKEEELTRKKEEEKKLEAEALFEQGLEYYKNENYLEAIKSFEKSYKLVKSKKTKEYLDKAKKKWEEAKLLTKYKKEAEAHLKLGISLYKKKKIVEALKELEKAVNLDPQNQRANFYLSKVKKEYDQLVTKPLEEGKVYLREGKLGDAINSFKKVLKIDPEHKVAKIFLQKALSLAKTGIKSYLALAEKYYDQEQYIKALENYREVLKIEPENDDAKDGVEKCMKKLEKKKEELFNQGVKLYENKKYLDAIKKFEEVLKIDPEHVYARKYLKKVKEEYEANKEKIELERYISDGREYFYNRNFVKAREYFKKALELDPENKVAKDFLKKCDKELKELEKQEKIAKILAEGLIAYRRKEYEKAISIWKRIKEIDPENEVIDQYIESAKKAQMESMNKYYNDGVKFLNDGNLLAAKEAFEKALKTNPNMKKAREKLLEVKSMIQEEVYKSRKAGIAYFKKGDYDKAIENLKKVLYYEKENPEVEDYLRIANECKKALEEAGRFMQQGEYGKAIEQYSLVLEYNPDDKLTKSLLNKAIYKGKKKAIEWFKQGEKYYKQGNLKLAYTKFLSVVKADPENQKAKEMLDKVKKEINKKCEQHYKAGKRFLRNKEYKKAIKEFESVLKYKNVYKDTGVLLVKARRSYKKKASKLLAQQKQKIDKYLYNGIKLYREGKLREAIREWEKVLKIDPQNVKAKRYIKRAKYKLRQLEKLK